MKIAYIHQYFKTPEEGGAIRSYHFAKALVSEGREVHVITAYNQKKESYKNIEGIHIHYLPVFYSNSLGFGSRIISFIKFLYLAYRKTLSLKGVQLCYATSTPLTIGIVALLLKSRKRIPYFFEVRDLWPEAPIQMGFIKNPFLIKLLYTLEKKIYINAEKIIALSPGIYERIVEKVSSNKDVVLIPNFADLDFFGEEENKTAKFPELPSEEERKDTFIIAYTGAMGKANGLNSLPPILRACYRHFKEKVLFLMAGDGSEKEALLSALQELPNVRYIGFINKDQIREVLHISHASLISFAPYPVLETTSPNKFFDALAAGKMCIVNYKGWIKELIESQEAGFYFNPAKPDEFIEKLQLFVDSGEKRRQAMEAASKLGKEQFSLAHQRKRFLGLFIEFKQNK